MPKFSPQHRLKKPREFQHVFANKINPTKRIRLKGIGFAASKNSIQTSRLGLAISKKKAKRAVDRNRIKRLTRESFRHHSSKLPSIDIIIFNFPELLKMNNDQISSELERLWSHLSGI